MKLKIPSITGLATTSAITTVKNKIPSISNLVKKADYNTKVTVIEKKLTDHTHGNYITNAEFNTLKLTQSDLITKTDFDNKLTSLNRKITLNKTRHLFIKIEFKKLRTFDLGYFMGKRYFDEDGTQNYLVFQSILKYFTLNSSWITKWKSKGLSNESLEVISTTSNSLNPLIIIMETK